MTSNLTELRNKRRNWVEANQENGFEDGIKRLLTDLYPDNAHFIYELLQNAEDTKASIVRFTLTNTAVEFEHNGERLFSLRDVESITSIGTSTKKNDTTSIGKFGVGFKAVFAYTNIPEIHSGNFHFQIHDLVVPETDGIQKIKLGEWETRFVFPLNNPKKPVSLAVKEIERGLRELGDNSLLFLSHIQKIEYLLPNGSLGSLDRINKSGGHIEIRAIKPGGEEAISHWLRFDKDVEVTDEDNNTKMCRIAIAYSIAEKKDKKGLATWEIIPLDRGQVSIYFPADKETSNLRFHIHAPFASTVARDSVRDCEANNILRNHIANLVVESLATIRDQGLLNVSFLAVLPNAQDNLPVFYEPIRKAIVDAFKSEPLTPTMSGSHAPARELYRGPAQIHKVLNDDDLSQLTQHAPPFWAKNPPQENQREDVFLKSLDIGSWGWSELGKMINKPHRFAFTPQHHTANELRKNLIENFIARKEDAWLQRFYALLGEACESHEACADATDLCIIRVESNGDHQLVKPGEGYFSPETDTSALPSDLFFVKQSVYLGGRSESQKKFARSFLEHAGVRPYDAKAEIERILEQYRTSQSFALNLHIKHIRQFVDYWKQVPKSIEMFKQAGFLICEEGNKRDQYFKASDLYLDSPYSETGLAALFNDNSLEIEKPKRQLSAKYHSIKKFEDFAVACGVMRQLEICDHKATEMQKGFFEKTGRETTSTIDEDYFINGVRWHQKCSDGFIGSFNLDSSGSLALSRLIWNRMREADPCVLVAKYMPNERRRHEAKSKSSFLVDYLKSHSWVADKDGHFLRPTQVTQETLHPDLKFDNRNGWLTAIGFGEDARKRSEEYQSGNHYAKKMGFDSVEELEELAKLKKEGFTVEDLRALQRQTKKTEQPKQSVPDPERRRKNVLANTADAPSKESVQRERSVQKGISEVAAQAKAYLRAKYKNDEGVLVCQCCHKEMPFKLSSGDYYFEAVQCIGEKGKETRHYQNRLALCPNCAAMYQYARDTEDQEVRRLVLESDAADTSPSVEIIVKLAGREFKLRFVGTHWFDLKTILGQP